MSAEELDVVLHIGYHKTGTTFFQKKVFNSFDNVLYLGRSWVHKDLSSFFYDFSFTNTLMFDEEKMRKRFYKIVADIVERDEIDISSKKMILISHESLHSGSDYFGFKIKDQAIRISQVFPNAKIIFSIRNQVKMIESHYTNYVHHGGKQKFSYFFNNSYAYNSGLKVKLKYNEVVNYYVELFGKQAMHVLVFEQIFLNNTYNLNKLTDFLKLNSVDIPKQKAVNNRMSKFSISIMRLINSLLAKDFNEQYNLRLNGNHSYSEKIRWTLIRLLKRIEANKLFPKSIFSYSYLSQKQKSELLNYYKYSNSHLANSFDLELDQYGYYIGE